MPTLEHNAIIEMFRERPELAAEFLAKLLHVDVPQHASASVVEASLDQLIPVEFRADLVIELTSADGEPVLAIILEAQRDVDSNKHYSWPVYGVVLRANKRCPVILLVVAPDERVAQWARAPIDLGMGLGTIRPLVLGPADVPEVTDPSAAAQDRELAVLSALAHGNGERGLAVLEAALVALHQLDREHAAVYFHVIWNALREPMRRALEARVMERRTDEKSYYPPFLQRVWEQIERDAERKGLHEGQLKGRRDALLRIIARTGLTLTEADRARIQACDDVAMLDRWVDNVLGAKTAADILA